MANKLSNMQYLPILANKLEACTINYICHAAVNVAQILDHRTIHVCVCAVGFDEYERSLGPTEPKPITLSLNYFMLHII